MAGSAPEGVIRVPAPSSERELRRALAARRPILIERALEGRWPALTRWTLDALIERAGDLEVPVRNYTMNVGVPRHLWKRYCDYDEMKFGDYVRRIRDGEAKSIYLAQIDIAKKLPPLFADVEKPAFLNFVSLDPVIWMGPAGHVEPLHFDTAHSVIGEIHGRKRAVLINPESYFALYPFPWWSEVGNSFSQVDLDQPDYQRFPKLREVKPIEVTIEAGDVLFIPAGWWHQIYCERSGTHATSVTYFCELRNNDYLASFKEPWVRHFEARRALRKRWLATKEAAVPRIARLQRALSPG